MGLHAGRSRVGAAQRPGRLVADPGRSAGAKKVSVPVEPVDDHQLVDGGAEIEGHLHSSGDSGSNGTSRRDTDRAPISESIFPRSATNQWTALSGPGSR